MYFNALIPFGQTLALGSLGAAVMSLLSVPAPFLIGPALFVTFGSLAGLSVAVPHPVRNLCFLVVGLSMGSSVTPEVVQAARAWPVSFVMVLVTSIILLWSAWLMLQRLFRYDRLTALLAACPGHLSYVLSLAAETRGDLASISIIQSVRVLALTLFVPVIVEFSGATGTGTVTLPEATGLVPLAAMGLLAAALGMLLLRLKVPAALLVGGMGVSILAHLGGFVHGSIPLWLQVPVYVVLGGMIGTRFSGVRLKDLRNAFAAGISVTILVGFISAVIAGGISRLLGVPLGAALIAFAPGGLETMAAMAVIMHADPAYVGTHHILRLLFLSVLMPFILSKFRSL
ncbi:AbrB family transcriptional regulator [Rhizobium straminoryzae]|uniref:AbrB family transcriptional regulator n=1 Tax=Rhizobium straminoryzae TaxID=1387186 RepID=A0A549T4D3_9HYPH|nr:AbrB family transcriptional regulator [Rhizobium straminoryzae]TRL36747.1 AbrB family transcriptional regulator [Rhizobium straminoryzae]